MSQVVSTDRAGASRTIGAWYWVAVALLIVKVLWGFWLRDLTSGDTSSYYIEGVHWAENRLVNIVWSPLYTAYLGAVEWVFNDARATVVAHRALLVAATTLLAAWAAMRTLPPVLALAAVIWWVALPIHYDTLYEVHLFGALVSFAAVLICTFESKWKLASLLALYGLSTVLVRNENIICFLAIAAYALYVVFFRAAPGYAAPVSTRGSNRPALYRLVVAAVLSAAVFGYFYQHSKVKNWRDITTVSAPKHRLNMCQVYAFGHQQRHPEWKSSPWTDCQPLMREVFGQDTPSITEMLAANPAATAEHFAWNLFLMPAGLQVLFLNATSFKANPDYAGVVQSAIIPHLLTLLVLAAFAICAWALHRRRAREGRPFLKPGELDYLVVFAANAAMILAVVLTQRPRPSYLLGFGFLCVFAFLYVAKEAFPAVAARMTRLFPWIAVAAVLLVPSYGALPLSSKAEGSRLGELYGLFKGHRTAICRGNALVAAGEYGTSLKNYLCPEAKPPRVFMLQSVGAPQKPDVQALLGALREKKINAALMDRVFLQLKTRIADCDELDRAFTADGWKMLVMSRHSSGYCDAAYARKEPMDQGVR